MMGAIITHESIGGKCQVGPVQQLARAPLVDSFFQTWTACGGHELLYERGVAEIHLNDPANGNESVSVQFHGEIYPPKLQMYQQTFACVNQNQREHGSFKAPIGHTPMTSETDLETWIYSATSSIRETPDIFEPANFMLTNPC
ncbi:hypothetical protein TNCV_636921 [Trichonephila clavipes]|nr:hypothetical protein TNCV_636921 [Trichonephila clavipes]